MNKLFKKYIYTISGLLAGAIGGISYWYFIGCANGQCLIQSKWYLMTLYGTILGGMIGNIIQGFIKNKKLPE
jgi:hypothetical protein